MMRKRHIAQNMRNVKEKELVDFTTRSRGWLGLGPIKSKNEKRNPKIRRIKAR